MFEFLKRGKIDIVPEKYSFSPGETIKGMVTLILKKPRVAEKFVISMLGEKTTEYHQNTNRFTMVNNRNTTLPSQSGSDMRTDRIFYAEVLLDKQKEYVQGEYPFEIKLPESLSTLVTNQNTTTDNSLSSIPILGNIMNTANPVRTDVTVNWYLDAQLVIDGALDMRKRIQINVI